MDLHRPLAVITPTLDGDVLGLLAGGDLDLTGREISRRIGASQEGVRRTLERLVGQGIVVRERAGNAYLFRLNRRHVAAPWIEHLAALRLELVGRLRAAIDHWHVPPFAVVLFGSAARGDADQRSDLDLFVVRPTGTDHDDANWRRQVTELETDAAAATGNDARVVEYSEEEVRRLWSVEPIFAIVANEGIELSGSLLSLKPRPKRRNRRP
jgi:predicted nucleotidyltransferase